MCAVPKECARLLSIFAPLCSQRVWPQVHVLVVGAILAPGKRTSTAALRALGRAHAQAVQPDQRVLHRAVWARLDRARLWLRRLGRLLAPIGPLVLGRDDPLERRRGAQIQATGSDRDPLRSSPSPLVNARGRRGLRLMWLVPMPWAQRVWAVPCMTVLAPSERSHQERRPRHQQLTDGARPRRLVVRRWVPERPLGRVTERRVAVMTWRWPLRRVVQPLGGITRGRWDAAL
jgi:hypothetical protein